MLIPEILKHAIVPSDQQQYHHHLVNGSPSIGCLEFYHVRENNLGTLSAIYLFLAATDHWSLHDPVIFTVRF